MYETTMLSSVVFRLMFTILPYLADGMYDTEQESTAQCVCGTISDRPDIWNKVETARWMVHNIDWGVLTTISSRTIENVDVMDPMVPFGNVYSFIDGSCDNATGIPYFYGTFMDQSLQDMEHNPMASLTLSEASIETSCMHQPVSLPSSSSPSSMNPIRQSCRIVPESIHSDDHHSQQHHHTTSTISVSGDPESPICARLTLTGKLQTISIYSDEFNRTQDALYVRHPQMSNWPVDHNWVIFKLIIYDVWMIDYFGGATTLTPAQYFNTALGLPYDLSTSESDIELNDPV
jgi:Pyridoxamine 5'-phosphate oxidase